MKTLITPRAGVGLEQLLSDVRACTICAAHLPQRPKPVLQVGANASILIAAQAPGRKVDRSGIPFDDASGERLRQWMGIDNDVFYDPDNCHRPNGALLSGRRRLGRRATTARMCSGMAQPTARPAAPCPVDAGDRVVRARVALEATDQRHADGDSARLARSLAPRPAPSPPEPTQQRLAAPQPMVRRGSSSSAQSPSEDLASADSVMSASITGMEIP